MLATHQPQWTLRDSQSTEESSPCICACCARALALTLQSSVWPRRTSFPLKPPQQPCGRVQARLPVALHLKVPLHRGGKHSEDALAPAIRPGYYEFVLLPSLLLLTCMLLLAQRSNRLLAYLLEHLHGTSRCRQTQISDLPSSRPAVWDRTLQDLRGSTEGSSAVGRLFVGTV